MPTTPTLELERVSPSGLTNEQTKEAKWVRPKSAVLPEKDHTLSELLSQVDSGISRSFDRVKEDGCQSKDNTCKRLSGISSADSAFSSQDSITLSFEKENTCDSAEVQRRKLCDAIRTKDMAKLMKILQPQDVDLLLEGGDGLLHYAISLANEEAAKFLLMNNANPNLANGRGSTPLHLATEKHLKTLAELLLGRRVTSVNAKDEDQYTALHWAAQNGDEAITRLLLDRGAAINETDSQGRTPAHVACQHGQENVVRVLLSRGADVQVCGKDNWAALHLAAWQGHLGIVKLLVKQAGANANGQTADGRTPLHLASQRGHYRVARILVELGADVGLTSGGMNTPLHVAAETGHTSTSRHLLKHRADIHAHNALGLTALHLASQRGHLATVKMLLDEGADPRRADRALRTPCHLASQNGHCEVVRELLSRCPESGGMSDDSGLTPLHLAVQGGHSNIISVLLPPTPLDCDAPVSEERVPPGAKEPETLGVKPLQRKVVILKLTERNNKDCQVSSSEPRASALC